jgi:hypothetical protein
VISTLASWITGFGFRSCLSFQCLLTLMPFHVFLHEIVKIVEGLESRHSFFKLVHSTMDKLDYVVDGVTEVFVERGGGRDELVITSHASIVKPVRSCNSFCRVNYLH